MVDEAATKADIRNIAVMAQPPSPASACKPRNPPIRSNDMFNIPFERMEQ